MLVVSALAGLSTARPAQASTPCGKKVLADWFDNGRIDRIYPLNCYEEGIDAIPSDLRDYANAEEVITRALQSALRGKVDTKDGGCDPSPDGSSDDCTTAGGGGGSGGNGGSGGSGSSGEGPEGGSTDPQAAPGVDTSAPSSVPVPLLVLAGLSLALLAAGGLGYLARRRQAAHADDLDGPA